MRRAFIGAAFVFGGIMLLLTTKSVGSTVTNTSQQITLPAGLELTFVSNTACWILQGVDPTAVATPGSSMYVPANTMITLAREGAKLAVIRDAADGKCSVTPGK